MSGLSGEETTAGNLGSSYNVLNNAADTFDSNILDNWKDNKLDLAHKSEAASAEGEAYLGIGFGEYSGYKLLKKVGKYAYGKYKGKKGDTESSNENTGANETADPDDAEIQMDEMPDASGFEGLDDEPTPSAQTTTSAEDTTDIDTQLQAELDTAPPPVGSAPKDLPDPPSGDAETADFENLPGGLGESAPQVSDVSTIYSGGGGTGGSISTADANPLQQLSVNPDQQALLDANRGSRSGVAESGIEEGETLDSLAPMREAAGLQKTTFGTGAETGGASGEATGSLGEATGSLAETGSGALEAGSTAVSGALESGSSALAAGAEAGSTAVSGALEAGSAALAGGAEAGAGLLAGVGDAALGAVAAIPVVGEIAAIGGLAYAAYEGLEDLFNPKKHKPAPAPPTPATYDFRGSSISQQSQIALPSIDGVVDTPASITAF